jgi:dolichyl-phosphate beta-glucosyltransferase
MVYSVRHVVEFDRGEEWLKRTATVTVILPVYNEEKCIANTLKSVIQFAKVKPHYQFIFVDDGSSDRTPQILQSQISALKNLNICACFNSHNQGKGYAVKTGILQANSEFVCFLDADLAYALDYLDLVVAKLEKFDIVIGCRTLTPKWGNGFNFSRKLAGKIFNLISRQVLNLKFTDMQAGIKGFKKPAAQDLFKTQTMPGFGFDVELIYLAEKKGYSIEEIPVIVSSKHLYKESKVKLFKHSLEMLFNLIQIRYNDLFGKYD